MARQSTGKDSKQDYKTPDLLFNNVKKRFNVIIDLAAHKDNHKLPTYFGPGGLMEDSFNVNWSAVLKDGKFGWLNPEFGNMIKWMAKCRTEYERGARFITLSQVEYGEWYTKYVYGIGEYGLKQRPAFRKNPKTSKMESHPRPCWIHIWHPDYEGVRKIWDWKKDILI